MSFDMARPFNDHRHPELVSGSISPSRPSVPHKAQPHRRAVPKASEETSRWTLKRVQGDGVFGAVS
jgi:hypothetical protein